MRAVAVAWVLCVLAGCTALYARGEGEVLIHVEGHPEALPEATEVLLATTGALIEGQLGVKSLHAGEAVEAKEENEATPIHYARQLEALEAGASPSEADDEGAMPLVGPWGGLVSPSELVASTLSEAKDRATPLVEAVARGHAGVVDALEAASTVSSQTSAQCTNSSAEAPPPQHHTCSHVANTTQWFIVAGPNTLYNLLLRPSAGSAPTEALPPQLPQTFNEWYTAAQSPLQSWWWWIHPSNYACRKVLAIWFTLRYSLSGSGILKACLSAIVFTTLVFAAYTLIGQPCIIIWDSQACLWKPTCMWEPPEEDLLAPATVDPLLVVLRLWDPAIMLGTGVVILRGLWSVLQSVFRAGAFTRVLLDARPRLRGTLRQMTTAFVYLYAWPFLLWPFLPLPCTNALFMVVILSVALDVEWWFVDRPSEGLFLATMLFPEYVWFCLIFCGLFLLDVFLRTKEDPRINALFQEPVELVQLARLSWSVFIEHLINKLAAGHPAAVINIATKLAAFQGSRPKHWPPPLVIPESLDDLIGDNGTPREFVCPLTFGLMRQPAVTPHGTTYDYEAVASWADAQGRYPANESNQPLSRSELAPNRVLRNMIEEWVAARSTVSISIVINP